MPREDGSDSEHSAQIDSLRGGQLSAVASNPDWERPKRWTVSDGRIPLKPRRPRHQFWTVEWFEQIDWRPWDSRLRLRSLLLH